jgi:murein L,D-transpeptidase YcbB/YkuD
MKNKALIAGVGMLLVSGCATTQQTQEINRLKSDVGLLDQRISQLERSNLKEQPITEWPQDTTATVSSAASTEVKPSPSSSSSSSYTKPSKREIQQALKNSGFYQGSVDGKIGPKTRDAVKQFQQANGLKADGIVGRQTWSKLEPYLAKSDGSNLSSSETIK